MVVTVRLMCLSVKALERYGISTTAIELESQGRDPEMAWVVELSGLAAYHPDIRKKFEKAKHGLNWTLELDKPFESHGGLCYLATCLTDKSLVKNSEDDSIPLPSAVRYVNMLQLSGLKIIHSQTQCSLTEDIKKSKNCVMMWTLDEQEDA